MEHPEFVGWAQTWHDDFNTQNRLHAIRDFGKDMVDPAKWKKSWAEGGGTSGILYLLSSASVTEVKAFCNVIRASNRRGKKSSERERAVEELVMALLPHHYPSAELRTRDERPLQRFYGRMLRGCSSDFVQGVLDAGDESNPLFHQLSLKKLICSHDVMLKRRLVNYLIHEGPTLSNTEIDVCFREFVFREPPSPGTQPNMSASMQFALELLQARITFERTAERWPREISELEVLMSVYRRLSKKSRSADKTFLIELALQLMALSPRLKDSSDAGVLCTAITTLWKKHPLQYEDLLSEGMRLGLRGFNSILTMIADRWKGDPDRYEHLLVQGLRQGLGGSADNLSEGYLKAISGIPRAELNSELRWRLLRLYCQHVPEKGIDIETSSDFKCLANQEWSFEIVKRLEREHAVQFLNRLYKVNPNFDFLRAPSGYTSIYSMRSVPRRNFNVELLLTAYHWSDADAQKRARSEVDSLRKTAANSREQEDRALFAKAAAHYAIATGDLEVYAETLLWQQRFIRDSFTLQSIFARDAILTQEGVALLSGIDLSSGERTRLNAIRERFTVANNMLKNLNEAKRMAKKEPSYNQSNWTALKSLYADVYSQRVSRVKKVKLQADESQLDTFYAIWEGTVDLVESIGSEFLSQVSGPIVNLLNGFSGPALITASETLLDYAVRWGKAEGGRQDHDDVAATMELLAYQIVSKLARSNTPVLARDLIRRAIIEHPEASSWHRQFLSIGYMKDLPAEAAKTMLLSFAAAIGEKLEEQSYVKVGDEEPAKSAPPRSLVKVSTVKYLAQLLNGADFISPDSAVEVLIELFKSGTHIDIRLATLDSLLSTLNAIWGANSEQGPMVEEILSALDTVIPVAGNVNERRPVGTRDWTEARENGTVPATSDADVIPPLFLAVLNATASGQFSNLRKHQRQLFSRLVLPILRHSQEQHHLWFSVFLAKHRPTLNADILPRIPIVPEVWHFMFHNNLGHLLPSETIDEYNQYILFKLKLPTDIKDLNKTLRSNISLRNDTSVNRWLSIFDDPVQSAYWHGRIRSFVDLVVAPIEKATDQTDFMRVVASHASVFLDNYEDYVEEWSFLVSSLGPEYKSFLNLSRQESTDHNEDTGKQWSRWHEATLSLAQTLIAVVEQKKASSAGKAVLPLTFPLRLWDLPYPDPRAARNDRNFRRLAIALDRSVSSFLASDEGDTLLWTTLVEDAHTRLTSIYKSITNLLCVAVHVGDLELEPDQKPEAAVQLIKVALALLLINGIPINGALQRPKKEKELTPEKLSLGHLVERLRAVMDRWGRLDAPGRRAPYRDMFLQWRMNHVTTWDDICSWDKANKGVNTGSGRGEADDGAEWHEVFTQ